MRYYLDTNILAFLVLEDLDALHLDVSEILADYSNQLLTSSVAVQELLYLFKRHKLNVKKNFSEQHIFDMLERSSISIVDFSAKHVRHYANMTIAETHKDHTDHAIIAQAIADKIPLISSDHAFYHYTSQGLNFLYNKR